jgi:hypothetical protein
MLGKSDFGLEFSLDGWTCFAEGKSRLTRTYDRTEEELMFCNVQFRVECSKEWMDDGTGGVYSLFGHGKVLLHTKCEGKDKTKDNMKCPVCSVGRRMKHS